MLSDDIKGTKELIDYQVKLNRPAFFGIPFSKYQKVYAKTNENLSGYINSDYIFKGTNALTRYYALGLKKAAILKYDYKHYLMFIKKILSKNISNSVLYGMIEEIIPYMDEISSEYWKEIISINKNIQRRNGIEINLIQMLFMNVSDTDLKNGYLFNEENYNTLKNNLFKSNISFTCCDCFDVSTTFSKQYDEILLSNIPDYFYKILGTGWGYEDIVPIIEKFKSMLNLSGNLFFTYSYVYSSTRTLNKTYPIASSKLKISDLENSRVITFPHISENEIARNLNDAMILIKK